MSAGTGARVVATVPHSLAGVRVDRALSLLTGVSRSKAASLVARGCVRVDGIVVGTRSMPLGVGGQLTVTLPQPEELVPDPDVPFEVVHCDDDLVVVDKPPGVVVHPGAGTRGGTLVAGLLARFPDIAQLGGSACDPMRPGIVHRLDKGTSGLLVVARSPVAYRSLVSQMAARAVGRRYLALVAGHVPDDQGVVDAPIGRSARTPTKMAVTAAGRAARTGYVVLERFSRVSVRSGSLDIPTTLLACTLETGRTHQIRVHLAAIGHPVVGDERYGRAGRRLLAPGRFFLHAAELSIDHPVSSERLSWSSPLPPDLSQIVERGPAPGTPARGGGATG